MSQDAFGALRWLTGSRLIAQAVSWISTIYVIRVLSPDAYGLVAMAGVFSGFLLLLGDFGLETALISRRIIDPFVLRAAHGATMLAGLLLFIAMFLTAPLVSLWFNNADLTSIVQATATMCLAVGFATVPRAVLARDMRFREISIAGMVASLLSAAATVLLAWKNFGVWSLVFGNLVAAFSKALLLRYFAGSMQPPTLRFAHLRGLAATSGYLLAERTVWYWYTQLDSLIVGRRLGDVTLGFLSVGKELAQMPVSKVVEITNQVALPLISKQQDDLRRVSQSFSKSLRLALTAGFPVMWGMAVVAQDLTILLLGPKWQSAVLVIQLIAVAMPLKLAGSLCGVALLAVGRADLSFRTILKSLVLAIILLHIGTRWGLPGAAFAVSAATILGTFIALGAVSACIPIERKVLLAELLRAAAPALVMVACVGALQYFTMQMQTLPRCVISVLCGAAVWVATIRTMAFALWEELVDNLGRFSGLR